MDGGAPLGLGMELVEAEEEGCAFIGEGGVMCGAGRQERSSYCPEHHALCHIPHSSIREQRRLRREEALAEAVGGRIGRAARVPPDRFLRRLERRTRHFF